MTDHPSSEGTRPADEQAFEGAVGSPEVRAERVEISQGGANIVEAQTVTIHQGGAGRVSATELTVSQGGIGLAQAERVTLNEGASAFAVVADEATVGEGSNVLLLVSRNPAGEFRPLLDWRSLAGFGAALGLVIALSRRRR